MQLSVECFHRSKLPSNGDVLVQPLVAARLEQVVVHAARAEHELAHAARVLRRRPVVGDHSKQTIFTVNFKYQI